LKVTVGFLIRQIIEASTDLGQIPILGIATRVVSNEVHLARSKSGGGTVQNLTALVKNLSQMLAREVGEMFYCSHFCFSNAAFQPQNNERVIQSANFSVSLAAIEISAANVSFAAPVQFAPPAGLHRLLGP